MQRGFQALAWVSVFFAGAPGRADSVGSPAPAVEPTEWLNTRGTVSWKDMKGRLVLVEKWATW